MEKKLNKIMKSTRKNKKYMVYVTDSTKKSGKKLVHFGDSRYQQYKDSTPLKLYSSKNHLDKKRRAKYFSRHGKTNDKTSAKYWSNKYLW